MRLSINRWLTHAHVANDATWDGSKWPSHDASSYVLVAHANAGDAYITDADEYEHNNEQRDNCT